MKLSEKDYVLCNWFCERESCDNWILTIVKRDKEWLGEYRFRYIVDDKHFENSNDRISTYKFNRAESETSEEEMLRIGRELFKRIQEFYPKNPTEMLIKGSVDKFLFQMAMQPWTNIKR